MTVPALSNAVKGMLTRAGVENPDGDAAEILCKLCKGENIDRSEVREGK